MALARVHVWSDGETLEASDLNGEINNILDNPITLISPLTANLEAGAFKLTGLGLGSVSGASLSATGNTGTGIFFSDANSVDIATNGRQSAKFATATTAVNYFTLTPAATGNNVTLSANGTDSNIGMTFNTSGTGTHIFNYASGATEAGRFSSGRLLWGTLQDTGAGAGDIVLSNSGAIRFVTADGSTTSESKINVNNSNDMIFSRPAVGNIYNFLWNGISHVQFDAANSGGVIRINTESTVAPTVLADGVAIYTKDNAGKTELYAQFSSGSPVLLAAQP